MREIKIIGSILVVSAMIAGLALGYYFSFYREPTTMLIEKQRCEKLGGKLNINDGQDYGFGIIETCKAPVQPDIFKTTIK